VRRKRGRPRKPVLTLSNILAWADAHRRRVGAWPTTHGGAVAAAPGETWRGINEALGEGTRGLPGGDSLARLLQRERAVPDRRGRARALARRQEATRLRRQGLTLAAIGKRLGVTHQAVSYLLRRHAAGGR
jgi:hypothetical protein